MNPIIRELLIEEPIKLSPEGQQAVISVYDIAVKNGFVGTELEWLDYYTGEAASIAVAAATSAGESALNVNENVTLINQRAQEALTSAANAAASETASGQNKDTAINRALVATEKAEESRLSALAAKADAEITIANAGITVENAGISTQKLNETAELAAQALASKNQSEAALLTANQRAKDSADSATASNAAKVLSEAAKVIAIEEAGKSSTSAGQSAASAAQALASNFASQTLLANFLDSAIISLNNRISLDGGTVVIKLRFVQAQLDQL
jgi:hypothetical protein